MVAGDPDVFAMRSENAQWSAEEKRIFTGTIGPSAFWWRMPDGRRMFVWLGDAYPDGYSYFEPNSWRRGPVPEASDTRYRPPRPGEILATVEHNGPTTVYTQVLSHPRLQWITRRLELWNHEPRARLTLRFCRISREAPELFFVGFSLPCEEVLPRTSNGGLSFIPYQDQLPGSCQDYFAIDGWVHYETPQGNWLWVSRDAPLVTFGDPQVLARRKDAPPKTNRVLAMVFDNRWFTNLVSDSHGVMEFQFDLVWKPAASDSIPAEALADTLASESQVIIMPSWKDDPIVARHLYGA